MPTVKKILVPTDFSSGSREALEHALAMGRAFGADVDVMHTWSMPAHLEVLELQAEGRWDAESVDRSTRVEVQRMMDDFVRGLEPPPGVSLRPWIERGDPAEKILEAASGYDMIVMSTHGRAGVSRVVLGSVAAKIIRGSPVPVMTVRMSPDALETEKTERRRFTESFDRTLYAMFADAKAVGDAYRALLGDDFKMDDMSIVMTEDGYRGLIDVDTRTHAREGVSAGTLLGGAFGGVVVLLSVLGAGVGASVALLVLGPALALAAAGGIVGGLVGWGVPSDQAQRIEDAIHGGSALLVVHVRDRSRVEAAEDRVREFGGDLIDVHRRPTLSP